MIFEKLQKLKLKELFLPNPKVYKYAILHWGQFNDFWSWAKDTFLI